MPPGTETGPPPGLLLIFTPRGIDGAGPAADAFCQVVQEAVRDRSSYSALEIKLGPDSWEKVAAALDPLLAEILVGWRKAAEQSGVSYRELPLASLAIDLDRPEDVDDFLARPGGGKETRRFFEAVGWNRGGRI